MTTLSTVVAALDAIAPPEEAAEWDNVGLLVGDPSARVTRALFAIDATAAVLGEAVRRGCQLVVSYHPPIFKGERRVLAGGVPFEAVRAGVAIYSPHTALDVAAGGTSDVLADALGLRDRAPLEPARGAAAAARGLGLGRIGERAAIERRALVDQLRAALGLSHVLVAGPLDGEVTRAAACAGSAGALALVAAGRGAGLYLTGELRHHDALAAARAGMTVVCALHSNSERVALPSYAARLCAAAPGVEACLSEEDHDPFVIA
ncbi:MAG: Nif3-like dinuclear metal center hexameric protein [Polyangiaceae bacterium]|nr:Nif3-like dinuclear metal center hexameric protein [Polyangiaceae bacterium]